MPILLAAIAVLGVSASGPLMAATAAPALAIAFWRNAAGATLIAPFALTRNQSELRELDRQSLLKCGLAGLLLAAHFAAWVSALKLTSVAAATALVTTQLIWIVLIDRFAGMRPSRAVLAGSALSIAGVLVISGFDFSVSTRAITGDLLAIGGGLFAALYLVTGNDLRRTLSTTSYTFVCYGVCAFSLAVAAVIGGIPFAGYSRKSWLLIAAVTISAQLLGHSLLNHLLAVMSPMVISLALLLEVPGAALLAGVFLGQSPPWGVYAGLVLILLGLAVVATRRQGTTENIVLAE
ncbi:MAG: DMT family transporter [Aeromicrobium sp.]